MKFRTVHLTTKRSCRSFSVSFLVLGSLGQRLSEPKRRTNESRNKESRPEKDPISDEREGS